jgi:hypothetical protein
MKYLLSCISYIHLVYNNLFQVNFYKYYKFFTIPLEINISKNTVKKQVQFPQDLRRSLEPNNHASWKFQQELNKEVHSKLVYSSYWEIIFFSLTSP